MYNSITTNRALLTDSGVVLGKNLCAIVVVVVVVVSSELMCHEKSLAFPRA